MARGSPSAGFHPPQPEDLRQRLYALERRRWRAGLETFLRGGRLVMRVEPTYRTRRREGAA